VKQRCLKISTPLTSFSSLLVEPRCVQGTMPLTSAPRRYPYQWFGCWTCQVVARHFVKQRCVQRPTPSHVRFKFSHEATRCPEVNASHICSKSISMPAVRMLDLPRVVKSLCATMRPEVHASHVCANLACEARRCPEPMPLTSVSSPPGKQRGVQSSMSHTSGSSLSMEQHCVQRSIPPTPASSRLEKRSHSP
jgi:hypothetical protein